MHKNLTADRICRTMFNIYLGCIKQRLTDFVYVNMWMWQICSNLCSVDVVKTTHSAKYMSKLDRFRSILLAKQIFWFLHFSLFFFAQNRTHFGLISSNISFRLIINTSVWKSNRPDRPDVYMALFLQRRKFVTCD